LKKSTKKGEKKKNGRAGKEWQRSQNEKRTNVAEDESKKEQEKNRKAEYRITDRRSINYVRTETASLFSQKTRVDSKERGRKKGGGK